MPAKIITLSQKDQDLLRLALNTVIALNGGMDPNDPTVARIKELKERLV